MSSIFKHQKFTLPLIVLGLLLVGIAVRSTPTFAITENYGNVPQYVLDELRRTGQIGANNQSLINDNTCAGGFNNAQANWVSLDRNDQVKNSLNSQSFSVADTVSSVGMRLNVLGMYCNSIISNRTGLITATGLKRTGFNVVSAPTVIVRDSNGQIVPGANVKVSGMGSGTQIIQSYQQAIDNNFRYAKLAGSNPDDIMEHAKFSLDNLSTLPISDGEYTISLNIPVRVINDFNPQYQTIDGPARFVCINVGPARKTENIFGTNNVRCDTLSIPVTIKLKRLPEYAGECRINKVNGINVNFFGSADVPAGQKFDAEFYVKNEGTKTWSTFFMKLGTWDPNRDSTLWGPNRLAIPNSSTQGGFPVIKKDETSTWTTTNGTFQAPSTPGEYTFSWRILQEGGTGSGYPNKTNLGDCHTTIKVTVPENRPFISISGGDVYSGAMFGVDGVCDPATSAASNAAISTNGYYGGNVGTSLPGSSNAQYAAYASGRIGQNGASNNAFRGNYAYSRPHTANPSLTSPDYLDDALFANLNVGTYPGNFYQGQAQPAVPCVPIPGDASVDTLDGTDPDASVRGFLTSGGSGTRKIAADNVTIGATTIPNGSRKTLLVDGDVTVAGNVTYDTGARTVDNIPYLKIVVSGNIYIEGGVGQLDGQYVARPTGSDITQSGLVDTCSTTGGAGAWPATLSVGSCDANQLVVNGSLSARRILWKRTSGTLGLIPSVLDPSCPYAKLSPSDPGGGPVLNGNNPQTIVDRYKLCAAERVDYSPEGYLTDLGGPSDSVPITTQELPPIY